MFKERLSDPVVIHGDCRGWPKRKIEERTKNNSDTIDPRDDELLRLKSVVNHLRERRLQVFVNENNHSEGSAPRATEAQSVSADRVRMINYN
jgi:hypothetical protein